MNLSTCHMHHVHVTTDTDTRMKSISPTGTNSIHTSLFPFSWGSFTQCPSSIDAPSAPYPVDDPEFSFTTQFGVLQ